MVGGRVRPSTNRQTSERKERERRGLARARPKSGGRSGAEEMEEAKAPFFEEKGRFVSEREKGDSKEGAGRESREGEKKKST